MQKYKENVNLWSSYISCIFSGFLNRFLQQSSNINLDNKLTNLPIFLTAPFLFQLESAHFFLVDVAVTSTYSSKRNFRSSKLKDCLELLYENQLMV